MTPTPEPTTLLPTVEPTISSTTIPTTVASREPTQPPTVAPAESMTPLPSSAIDESNRWLDSGKSLYYNHNYLGALEAFEKAIGLNPQNYAAWYGKSKALEKLKRFDDARSAFEKAHSINHKCNLATCPGSVDY
jgi:cytochrome c-type biogenesis protein CcmH/NrfG